MVMPWSNDATTGSFADRHADAFFLTASDDPRILARFCPKRSDPFMTVFQISGGKFSPRPPPTVLT
jgi:hypothetical protein